MSKTGWRLWIVAFGAWALYSCWHMGYQSGYADGHETAWKMYQPSVPDFQIAAQPNESVNDEIDDPRDFERRR
jgi:hypothetical protein